MTAVDNLGRALKKRRVLVVEDNLDNARTTVQLLQSEGHTVDFAINGYVAITLAHEFLPDVVILDIGLPGLNGYEVCAALKRDPQFKNTRFIAVTGYNRDEDRTRSREVGCDIHLAKPADPEQLLALVRE